MARILGLGGLDHDGSLTLPRDAHAGDRAVEGQVAEDARTDLQLEVRVLEARGDDLVDQQPVEPRAEECAAVAAAPQDGRGRAQENS
jgi:hypothetical protein